MGTLVRRFIREDDGQDLVEYALIVALVALVSAAALGLLQTAVHDVYVSWDLSNQSLWEMPAPGGS